MSKLVREGLTVWAFDVQDTDGVAAELEIQVSGGRVTWSGPVSWSASPEVTRQIEDATAEAEDLARKQRGE